MNLKFKRPSKETQLAMSKVAIGEDDNDYYGLAEDKVAKATGHSHAKLVSSGNAAILSVMNAVDGAVLIPDQGAWNGFKQIAKFLNKDVLTVKTNQGLIETELLEDSINQSLEDSINQSLEDSINQSLEDSINKFNNDFFDSDDDNKKSALFLTSFAGYTAEQNIKEISEFAHENNILLVEDASGAVCDSKRKLANGKYSDIIMASTGSPKIVNVGDGGFITTNDGSLFDKSRLLLKTNKASNITACGINSEMDFARDILNRTIDACSYLKEEIVNNTDFELVHPNSRGINLILKANDPKSLSYKLRQEFTLDSHGIISKCPNYNRLKEKAVAIEIKNLDVSCLNQDNLNEILRIIKNQV